MTKRVERWGMGQEADTVAVKCPSCLDVDLSQRSYSEEPGGPRRYAVPTIMGHSHTINILLLFIGHLGSRKTCPAQRFKSESKAPLFLGLV